MANPAGIVNGTKVLFKVNTGSGFVVIEGESTHSMSFNREAIETTNKSSDQYRTYLDGDEGTKSIDVTVDSLYSDDAAYQFLRAKYFDGAIFPAERVIGSLTTTVSCKVTAMSDTADRNNAVSTSFTLNSSGAFSEA
jgi:predicted secreted protein